MNDSKEKKVIDNLRKIVKDYDIKVLLSKTNQESSSILGSSLNISSHFRTNADNVISVSRVQSSHLSMNIQVQKVRNPCPIMELLKSKDYEGLEKYMSYIDKEILSVVDVSKYSYNLSQSCIYILKNNMLEFLPVIEKSALFDKAIKEKEKFWIKTIFSADNYNILVEKRLINDLFNRSDCIELLINQSPIKIVNELLKKENFREKLEKEFNFISYIPIMMESKKIKMLENILEVISIKNLKINWDETFQLFDKSNSMDNEKNNRYYFNEALKVLIINSDYNFEKKDLLEKKIDKENKNIIRKKILNQHLNDSLEPKIDKAHVKKIKI